MYYPQKNLLKTITLVLTIILTTGICCLNVQDISDLELKILPSLS